MPKIVILRGLPASGKSTLARKMVAEEGYRRVNKDDLRQMLDGGIYSAENEKLVIALRDYAIFAGVTWGHDIVVDDCHNNPKHIAVIAGIAEKSGADCRVIDVETPVDECIRRDALRPNPVGEARIRQMAVEIAAVREKERKTNPITWKTQDDLRADHEVGRPGPSQD